MLLWQTVTSCALTGSHRFFDQPGTPQAALSDGLWQQLLASPASRACTLAADSGELERRLRTLKNVLQADCASAVLDAPQFWSTPLERSLLPRHGE